MTKGSVSILNDTLAIFDEEYEYEFEINENEIRTEASNNITEYDIPKRLLDALGVEGLEYGEDGVTIRMYDIPNSPVTQVLVKSRS